jgi:hypothetical protein
MKRLILAAAIAVTIGVPSVANAQAAPAPAPATAPLMGTTICRPVTSGETPNATLQGKPVLCHPVAAERIRSAMNAMMNDASMNDAQKAKAQAAMTVMQRELQIMAKYPGQYDTSEY